MSEPALSIDFDALPTVHLVTELVEYGLRCRASDIHLEPLRDDVRIRVRVDGSLIDIGHLPFDHHVSLVSRLKILAGMNIVERRRPQDGQFSTTVDGRDIDVRLASVSTVFGEKVVLRLLDKNRTTKGLTDLGMPADTYRTYSTLIRSPFGMVICAGPTGAGKTTTLYASLLELDADHANITSIEDPVEYVFSGINQIKTNEQAGLTFASGLRALLRQDPDIILVGEIRDPDTARLAVQAAHTGHLVLSSIHASDSTAALYRLLEMDIEGFLVASSVIGVVGQRLLRRICPHCSIAYEPSSSEIDFLRQHGLLSVHCANHDPANRDLANWDDATLWRGEGCSACNGTGYHERIGIYEVLRVTPRIRTALIARNDAEEVRAAAIDEGMRPLLVAAGDLIAARMTTVDEVIRTLYHS